MRASLTPPSAPMRVSLTPPSASTSGAVPTFSPGLRTYGSIWVDHDSQSGASGSGSAGNDVPGASASASNAKLDWAKQLEEVASLSKQLQKSHKDVLGTLSRCQKIADDGKAEDEERQNLEETGNSQLRGAKSEPRVLVSDPWMRGVTAGQFREFFKLKCGEITLDQRKQPFCLPTKLAERIMEMERAERVQRKTTAAPFKRETNLYSVTELIIVPDTANDKISYAEFLNPKGKEVEYFISHHWGEDWAEFVQSILRHSMLNVSNPRFERPKKSGDDIIYWCCAFANNQHMIELGDSLQTSPFYLVLMSEKCIGCVMNLNAMMTALTRVWCIYETFLTTTKPNMTFEINTRFGPITQDVDYWSPERDLWVRHMNRLLDHITVEEAESTTFSDKEKILAAISSLKDVKIRDQIIPEHGAAALNRIIRHMFAESAIFSLAYQGDANQVRKALQLGVDPNKCDSQCMRPLTYATAMYSQYLTEVIRQDPTEAENKMAQVYPPGTDVFFRTAMALLDKFKETVAEKKDLWEHNAKVISDYKATVDTLVEFGANSIAKQSALDVLNMFSEDVRVRQKALKKLRMWKREELKQKQSELDLENLPPEEISRRRAEIDQGYASQQDFLAFHKDTLHAAMTQHVKKCFQKSSMVINVIDNAGNLCYRPEEAYMKNMEALVGKIHECQETGREFSNFLKELFKQHQLKGDPPEPMLSIEQIENRIGKLMLVFTDLEPDDTMGIAQLWQLKLRNNELGCLPIIVFCTDMADKDCGYVFDKKVLVAGLMLGVTDIFVLTDRRFEPAKAPRRHPNAARLHERRRDVLFKLVQEIQQRAKKCNGIDVYIMCPARGSLGEIWNMLGSDWPLPFKWSIAIYSGSFNIRNMQQSDFVAIESIGRLANRDGQPLVDIAKYPFFGGETFHPCTHDLTTFAMETWPLELVKCGRFGQCLAAALKLFNDEHNAGLIDPRKLFGNKHRADEVLSELELSRFTTISRNYKFGDSVAMKSYARQLTEDSAIFAKIATFKKKTVLCFAHGSCNSPLCDQIIFLYEWIMAKAPDVFKDLVFGVWTINEDQTFSKPDLRRPFFMKAEIMHYIATNTSNCISCQPVLWDPFDEDTLMRMRKTLQHYMLLHIKAVHERSDQDRRHTPVDAGHLIFDPPPSVLRKTRKIISQLHSGGRLPAVLRSRGHKLARPPPNESGTTMVVIFADLQPDVTMAICQLWRRKISDGTLKDDPVIVCCCDFDEEDRGTIFDKKLLLAGMMFGDAEVPYLVTPDQVKLENTPGKPPVHILAREIHEKRNNVFFQIDTRIKNFRGQHIEVYIMAPLRGCLARVFSDVRQDVTWRISMYTGHHNTSGLLPEDIEKIKHIACVAQAPLIDIAKFCFFGGKGCHAWTASFATFATENLAARLSEQNNLIAACLRLYNDEANAVIIAPEWDESEQTYSHLFTKGALSPKLLKEFEEDVKPLWNPDDSESLKKYARTLLDNEPLMHGVKDFKKSLVAAFAYGGCDFSLCGQVVFLYEWLAAEMKEALADTHPGRWVVDAKNYVTKVMDMPASSEGGILALQPKLREPTDEDALKSMRASLEECLLAHLRTITFEDSEQGPHEFKTAGNLVWAPTPSTLKAAESWTNAINETLTIPHLREVLSQLQPEGLPQELTTGSGGTLMVVFTSLENDDAIAISQLWQLKVERGTLGQQPVIVYIEPSDSVERDSRCFGCKMLAATLLFGFSEFYFLLEQDNADCSSTAFVTRRKKVTRQSVHRQEQFAQIRSDTIHEICQRILSFKGTSIDLYIMGPCCGNLASVVQNLLTMDPEALHKFQWNVTICSSAYENRGMNQSDLNVMAAMSSQTSPIVDIASNVFFGGACQHPRTVSFTTFADPTFTSDLNLVSPLVVAALKLTNGPSSSHKVNPDSDHLFQDRLTADEQQRFDAIKSVYKSESDEDIIKYCAKLMEDDLFLKLYPRRRCAVASLARGGYDMSLGSQAIFMREWLNWVRPGYLDENVGDWQVHEDSASNVATASLSTDCKFASSVRVRKTARSEVKGSIMSGLHPQLPDPGDDDILDELRKTTKTYLIKHLRRQRQRPDEQSLPQSASAQLRGRRSMFTTATTVFPTSPTSALLGGPRDSV